MKLCLHQFITSVIISGVLVIMTMSFACTSPSNSDPVLDINLIGGAVTDGRDKVTVKQGDDVSLIFSSDRNLKLHLHGYDVEATVPAGGEANMEFHATATGRFAVTSHPAENHHGAHSTSGHSMGDSHIGHGNLFESDTLSTGGVFSYNIPEDMGNGEIPYHDHMNHGTEGSILVSSSEGEEDTVEVSIREGDQPFQPVKVMVKPGATVRWTSEKKDKVRLTSGQSPAATVDEANQASGHGMNIHEGDSTENEEETIIFVEVRP